MDHLINLVREAFANAEDSGYEFDDKSDEDVASDLIMYEPEIGDMAEDNETFFGEVVHAVSFVRK